MNELLIILGVIWSCLTMYFVFKILESHSRSKQIGERWNSMSMATLEPYLTGMLLADGFKFPDDWFTPFGELNKK